ncbi:hypothetical protein MYE70_10550 [Marinobacter alexandrii]|uniref:hypothetical protein n=1 Tax=Marinobacter alexandrii TaxID=2570351 RepID=UPI001FFE2DDF|nr:hypothetical protein [Marinobacter alexandrii]MCK2149505.1 hypothetical protein [Marinobacter alexandrii]
MTGNESIYCPVCGRVIYASNEYQVWTGEHDGYLFIHDEIPHSDDDMQALERGVQ